MHSARRDAVLDMAVAGEDALATYPITLAKQILPSLAGRLTPSALLLRIKESRCAGELMEYLPPVVGMTHAALSPFMEALSIYDLDDRAWREVYLKPFADTYWACIVRERIVRKDWRRAWDEIKKAAAYNVPRLCASSWMLRELVGDLYQAMREKGDISLPEELGYGKSLPALTLLHTAFPSRFPRPDRFGRPEWGPLPRVQNLTDLERTAVGLALHFREVRKRKRQRRVDAAVAGSFTG